MILSPEELGKRLRDARLAAVLSQDHVAALMRVDRSSIARWERGSRPITFQALQQLAEVLRTSLSELADAGRTPGTVAIEVPRSAWEQRSDLERQSLSAIVDRLAASPDLLLIVRSLLPDTPPSDRARPPGALGLLRQLADLDLNQVTPLAALTLLDALKRQMTDSDLLPPTLRGTDVPNHL